MQLAPRLNVPLSMALLVIVSCGILVASNGNLFAALFVPVAVLMLAITIFRPDWGFVILVSTMLFCDQYSVDAFPSSLSYRIRYFWHLQDIPYLIRLEGVTLNLFELHVLLVLAAWILAKALRRTSRPVDVPTQSLALCFLGWIAITFVRGLGGGSQLLPAIRETRGIIYFLVLFFFTPRIVTTEKSLRMVIGAIIGILAIKAVQAIINVAGIGLDFGTYGYLTPNQEDAVFFVDGLALLAAMATFRARSSWRGFAFILVVLLSVGFFLGNRRSVYVSALVTALAFVLSIRGQDLRRVMLPLGVSLFFGSLYIAAFWNSGGLIGFPAQQVKSVFVEDDSEVSQRNASSNLYRKKETYNLAQNIQKSPLVGLGFGVPYDTPLDLHLRFGLSSYVAHNSIVWLFMRIGGIGFFFFLLFLGAFLYWAALRLGQFADPFLKAVCIFGMLSIINQMVVAYAEMQLTYYRNMSLLGIVLGLVVVAHSLDLEKRPTANPNEGSRPERETWRMT